VTSRNGRLWLATWTALLAAILFPWFDVTDHTHWMKVTWIPFAPPWRPFDIVANVMVFIPFGALWRRARFGGVAGSQVLALTIGGLLSACAESAQLYSHSRFPSATDVTTNLIGIAVGWWLAWRRWSVD
jgi:glycopeptide antibiotics resistance protein